ncbi:MAG: sugar transferase [Dysgonamonadaceae bacterium]|jgi:exopolysaccharide biosynthesis polyprenyl glycosylphosphotransferase|nr:sugar transferase [Dysgonamonadaceae bacterium]
MRRKTLIKYVLTDFVSANAAWLIFNIVRYFLVARSEGFTTLSGFLEYVHVLKGQVIIPMGWLVLHYYSGYYNTPLVKSRISEFFTTAFCVLLGSVIVFFGIVLNHLPESEVIYYQQFTSLFLITFVCTYFPRLIITNASLKKISAGEWSIRALLLGTGERAFQTWQMLMKPSGEMSYNVAGFIKTDDKESVNEQINVLGSIDDLENLIKETGAEELIVSTEADNDEEFFRLIYSLYRYKLPVKLPLSYTNILMRGMKIRAITGVPLIDITNNNFSEAGKNIKLTLDKITSFLVLLLFSPLYLFLAAKVKRDSEGPVFVSQERIGLQGKPFMMYKFRTMRADAEREGPSLSSENDPRITRFGTTMRKYRLDELPQFWNVLKGDMSLVGPRPERKYYIDQIVKIAPEYCLLHNVRPGISSLGMVKFGYARNVEEMTERMQYDILYYENMSLMLDLKILIYSMRTIWTGKGI